MNRQTDRNQAATLWVGSLDDGVDEELLWELFVQAGPVVDVCMPKDKVTGRHQNYSFIEFKTEADADYAMKVMNTIKLFGKSIRINRSSREKEDFDIGANLFVGNLDPDVDDQILYNTFSAFGQVLSAKAMADLDGSPRGFGFVHFASFEASDAALEAMNGQYLCNRPIHVSYAYKKDGTHGERHGSSAERALAANKSAAMASTKTSTRVHMQFSAGGQHDGGQGAMNHSMAPPSAQYPHPPAHQMPPMGMAPPPLPNFGGFPAAAHPHAMHPPPSFPSFPPPLPPAGFVPPPPPNMQPQQPPPLPPGQY